MLKRFLVAFIILILGTAVQLSAQKKATVYGIVRDSTGLTIPGVSILVSIDSLAVSSDGNGRFSVKVPTNQEVKVQFSYVGYKTQIVKVNLKPGESKEVSPILRNKSVKLGGVEVVDEISKATTLTRMDPKFRENMTSASGNFEDLLFTLPGVSSTNELSSSYNVRGGNFDENLIYVNDVEIYRPFLVRSGQQEGLSFINSDMVSSILFSAGGFEARYGDKMSSVLDIRYAEPRKFSGSASISLLGASVHLEGSNKDHRFTHIQGFRYRSNQYLLNGLQTQGDYRPRFYDYQGYFTYDLTTEWEIGLLLNYSNNQYRFIPETRETEFGTVNEALQLTVFFDGQEIDEYETGMGAFTATYKPNRKTNLKFIASGFRTLEQETFDIQGAYRLAELEKDPGSENFGEVKFNRGVGGFINHARNYLEANVFNIQHKGVYTHDWMTIRWGGRYQHEQIKDELKEWDYLDSTGYSVPQSPGITGWSYAENDTNLTRPTPISPRDKIEMNELIVARNDISSNRVMGYLQGEKAWDLDSHKLAAVVGVRFNYWDFNNEAVFSPRASIGFQPNWKKRWNFRAAWGYYYQPPFYREMRDLNGHVNSDIKAQQSIHYVLGADYQFKLFKERSPFKLTAEVYYKNYKNLIPYEIDNVRLRYYATNNSNGYATGVDLKLFGEFVKGIDSWFSLSVMKTEEDIVDDFYWEYYNAAGEEIIPGFTYDQVAVDSQRFEPGAIPRPTDQRFQLGFFFQDYVPKIPSLKVNLNFVYASGLPFGPPTYERYKDTLRMPPYRRVDIGFSYQLLKSDRKRKANNPIRYVNNSWLSLEIFNLFGINNTISYLWVRDISDRMYGIPNYLTNRRINLKWTVKF
ncbi:TonB-dependent receptor [bacterium SCSIO 12741]|nr:TonB-dependent receptor [bacterium SCSIO 12741]